MKRFFFILNVTIFVERREYCFLVVGAVKGMLVWEEMQEFGGWIGGLHQLFSVFI